MTEKPTSSENDVTIPFSYLTLSGLFSLMIYQYDYRFTYQGRIVRALEGPTRFSLFDFLLIVEITIITTLREIWRSPTLAPPIIN